LIKQAALLLSAVTVLAGCATTVAGQPSLVGAPASSGHPVQQAIAGGHPPTARPTTLTALAAAAEASLKSARSFRYIGTGKDGRDSVAFDLHYGDNGSAGTVKVDGYTLRVREIGSTLYINGNERFWRHAAAAAGANSSDTLTVVQMYAGLWCQVPSSNKEFALMAGLADRRKFLSDSGDHGKLVSAGTKTINGVRAKGIVDTRDKSVLWVRAVGTPVPVEITQPGQGKGDISAVNVPFHVPSPPLNQVVTLPS
jgi:hypothetical protein